MSYAILTSDAHYWSIQVVKGLFLRAHVELSGHHASAELDSSRGLWRAYWSFKPQN